jgi:hypothetical protein
VDPGWKKSGSGIKCFWTHRIQDGKNPDPGLTSRIILPESLLAIFGLKILTFFVTSVLRIRGLSDLGSGMEIVRIRDSVLLDPWFRDGKCPDPGSSAFLTPGLRMEKSGSRINIPDHIAESLQTIWVKNTFIFCPFSVADQGPFLPWLDGRNPDPG